MVESPANLQCYLVGGAVRDEILGLPVKDRDWVVVGADAQQMSSQGFRPVGRDFGTRIPASSMRWRAPSGRAAAAITASPYGPIPR
jgi:hypothetical protein